MAVTVQALRAVRPNRRWFLESLGHEAGTAVLLGCGCGAVVTLLVFFWRGVGMPGLVIGGSIALSLCGACFFGLCIPALLHWLKLDPKIAAGPVTLALTDITTLASYFGMASLIL